MEHVVLCRRRILFCLLSVVYNVYCMVCRSNGRLSTTESRSIGRVRHLHFPVCRTQFEAVILFSGKKQYGDYDQKSIRESWLILSLPAACLFNVPFPPLQTAFLSTGEELFHCWCVGAGMGKASKHTVLLLHSEVVQSHSPRTVQCLLPEDVALSP